jgi:hypothetical protein
MYGTQFIPCFLGRLIVSPGCLGKVLDPVELRGFDPDAIYYLNIPLSFEKGQWKPLPI